MSILHNNNSASSREEWWHVDPEKWGEPSERDRRISELYAEDKKNGEGREADRVFFEQHPERETYMRPLTDNELEILYGESEPSPDDENWVAVWQHAKGHFVRRNIFLADPPTCPLADIPEDIPRKAHGLIPKFKPLSPTERRELYKRVFNIDDISLQNPFDFGLLVGKPWGQQTEQQEPEKLEPEEKSRLTIPNFSDDWCDVTKIPRRRWLYGQHYIRGAPTITIAEGGIGKSTLEICEAIAIASGEALLGVTVDEPVKVWYWNGEEPWNEIARRVHAVCEHYKIPPRSIADKFHFTSGLDQFPIKIVRATPKGIGVDTKLVAAIVDYIRANDIGVVFIDPLISCHSVAENDTCGMDAVAKTWSQVAAATNCAIELVHHTRKPAREGDSENHAADARGAGALIAAVRGSRVINQMTEKEAGEFDIEGERFDYFRVNRAKVNMSRRSGSTSWFRLVPVAIGNGEPNNPTDGDNVQTLTSWKPPDVFDIITVEHMHAVRAKAATGEYMRDPRAKDGWFGEVIAEVVGLDVETQRPLIEKVLATWLELGLLKTVSLNKGKETNYRERKFVEAGDWVPPEGFQY
jgi:hypothetical protein